MRKPFFFAALGCLLLVVLFEAGANLLGMAIVSHENDQLGYGLVALARVDALLAIPIGLLVLSLVDEELYGKVQAPAMLVGYLVVAGAALCLLLGAITELMIMLGLLLSGPFGPLAYLAMYGRFPRPDASAVLALVLLLKIGVCGLLLAAQPRFLSDNLRLVVTLAVSLACTWVVVYLHGSILRPLVSVTDAIGGIVVCLVALVLALYGIIGSIGGVGKVIRSFS